MSGLVHVEVTCLPARGTDDSIPFMIEVEAVWERPSELGEGPLWWGSRLFWVDIDAGQVLAWTPETGERQVWKIPEAVGSLAPCLDGRLLLATASGFCIFSPHDGGIERVDSPGPELMQGRFNDGKCSPHGRFFAGTINDAGNGSLFRLDPDLKWRHLFNSVHCSNGLCWFGGHFYYIDTPTRRVDVFDYDGTSGDITRRRTAISTDHYSGSPDGMTVDREGRLWVAFWGGGCVRCFDRETAGLLEEIPVPAQHVTSCCFGGTDLEDLYITTARVGLTVAQLEHSPLAGSLFRCRPGAAGLPADPFGWPQ